MNSHCPPSSPAWRHAASAAQTRRCHSLVSAAVPLHRWQCDQVAQHHWGQTPHVSHSAYLCGTPWVAWDSMRRIGRASRDDMTCDDIDRRAPVSIAFCCCSCAGSGAGTAGCELWGFPAARLRVSHGRRRACGLGKLRRLLCLLRLGSLVG